MYLYRIITSIRTVTVWVSGYERSALAAYHRSVGEVIHLVVKA